MTLMKLAILAKKISINIVTLRVILSRSEFSKYIISYRPMVLDYNQEVLYLIKQYLSTRGSDGTRAILKKQCLTILNRNNFADKNLVRLNCIDSMIAYLKKHKVKPKVKKDDRAKKNI